MINIAECLLKIAFLLCFDYYRSIFVHTHFLILPKTSDVRKSLRFSIKITHPQTICLCALKGKHFKLQALIKKNWFCLLTTVASKQYV